jgi:hypothetical protein
MSENNNELKDFISESLRQIRESHTNKLSIDRGIVRFEIAVTKKDIGGGKVGIKVLGIGGEIGKDSSIEHASKIMFETYIEQDSNDDYDPQSSKKDWSIG